MGDMIRCGKCGTFHYRNDPCPDEEEQSKETAKEINEQVEE